MRLASSVFSMSLTKLLVVSILIAGDGGCAVSNDSHTVTRRRMEPPASAPTETQPASSSPAEKLSVTEMLESIREKYKLPALAGAIVRIGDTKQDEPNVEVWATGLRADNHDVHVTPADLWHLGSNTKALTATLIALLVEEGALRWNTTLAEGFPDLVDRMHPDWRTVTVEQLLSHHGGAPADLNADGLWLRLWQRRGTPVEQRRELVEGVLIKPPAAPPGTKYIYSNAGYAIAGALAERVTGIPWEEMMQTRLFAPLRITTAGFGAPGDAAALDQPWGHRRLGETVAAVPPGPTADNPPAIGPAGTVHMSLGDYAKFVALHLAGERGNAKLLRSEIFRKLQSDAGDGYALGWGVAQRDWGGHVLMHEGSNTMWYCVAWLAPEKGFAVIAATNQGGSDAARACDEVSSALIRQILAR